MSRFCVYLPVLVCLSCDGVEVLPGEPELECGDDLEISSTVIVEDMGEIVRGDLVIRGSASHSEGLVIRSLSVLGQPVEQGGGFNYDNWTVTIPHDVLLAAAKGSLVQGPCDAEIADPDEDRAGLPVTFFMTATDPCSKTPRCVELESVVDIRVEPRIEDLSLSIEYAAGDYAPAGDNFRSRLVVSGGEGSEGAAVSVSGSGLSFESDGKDSIDLYLDAGGKSEVLVWAKEPGDAVIIAQVGEITETEVLKSGGAPRLSPTSIMLPAGGQAYVSGQLSGDISAAVRCRAEATVAASITKAKSTESLTAPNGVLFPAGEEIAIKVEINADATETSFGISCEDELYHQLSQTVQVNVK